MLAILSDIHANLAALEAVLEDARARGCDDFICLGDVIGYNAEPEECCQLLMQNGIPNILGNHDSYITTGENCTRSQVVASIIDDHRSRLSPESIAWLARSSSYIRNGDILMVHGGPDDPLDQYIREIDATMFPDGVNVMFAGHTHVQFSHRFGEKLFCNPGSVGQPRDGDPRAAYAIWHERTLSLHRVEYDIDRTISVMQARGYEPFLARGLPIGAQINGRVDTILVR
ncbi:metallophosphoesterase family protein [Hoeflea alexandrii]|uniref:Metallophosphoesterase n=1 Tax=Hoeflea alexandrii TaxID=288436 RepID=A0ABT1CYP0_9HYPH|nr:metallophosphoesterase family protein [Hoeflea alexandrii]MCO6410671.1 metallophosphoesterase [Hoeflea alexandrii]MCY0152198.1 metallophosphatase family protein [Hoeflea alexandrii]